MLELKGAPSFWEEEPLGMENVVPWGAELITLDCVDYN